MNNFQIQMACLLKHDWPVNEPSVYSETENTPVVMTLLITGSSCDADGWLPFKDQKHAWHATVCFCNVF